MKAGSKKLPPTRQGAALPVVLAEVDDQGCEAFGSGLAALDRVLGQGFVPGAAILVGGEPGIGKSTLLLQVAGSVASGFFAADTSANKSGATRTMDAVGRKVVYVSGEESLAQIKGRAARLNVLHENLLALATNSVEDLHPILENNPHNTPPALIIVDSVQTLSSLEAEGLPGNVSQVRAVAGDLLERCRACGTTLVLVGHVTKEGNLAGPRLLEHMVDTVISLEGDRRQMFRLLRVFKNRFGPNEELLVFHMLQGGLKIIEDPSTYFLGARDASLSGTAVVMAVDGHRPLAVEVQALVTRSYLAIPRRTGLGFDTNRLHLLLAVLEKRLKVNFGQVDIYAKVGGGLRISDPGMDLALVAAVLSSFYDIPLPERAVLWGEVDLNGQVRPVSAQEIRYTQASRLGYNPIIQPDSAHNGIETVTALQQMLFAKKR